MMRITLPVVCLMALGWLPSANAADPIVWRMDYATARKEAAQKNLPLLVVVGTADCVYCRKMEAITYVDPETSKLIAQQFVALKIDANRDPEFARALKVTLYPTAVLAGTDGRVVGFLQGYLPPDQFREHAGKALLLLKPAAATAVVAARPVPVATPTAFAKPAIPAIPVAIVPQPQPAPALLAAAQQAYTAERFGECLDRCEELLATHQRTPQAEDAAKLMGRIKADPDKLAAAEIQLDERLAATYVSLGDTWSEKGRQREATVCYEKSLKLLPSGKLADQTRAKLAELRREGPALGVGAERN